MKCKRKNKNEEGITLVALIITIIVLIILAAVSISAVYDSKLIGYATNGTQNYMTEGNTENEVFANTVSYVDSVLDAIFYEGTGITGGDEDTSNPPTQILIEKLTLSKTSASMMIGNEITLTVSIKPEEAKNEKLKWTSSNPDVATVENGVVTAIGEGNATITVEAAEQSDITATCKITVEKLAEYVEELEAGDYVNYIDKNNVTRLSIVLYDSTSSYGVQIITKDTADPVSIGSSSSFSSAKTSYNKAISTLNTKANEYLNTKYATAARSVGTKPDDPTTDTSSYYTDSGSFFSSYTGTLKTSDGNYRTDHDQMVSLGVSSSNTAYWLGSRYINQRFAQKRGFTLFTCYADGTINSPDYGFICYVDYNGSSYNSYSYNLRPVFTLRAGLGIVGGSGAEEDPYILQS